MNNAFTPNSPGLGRSKREKHHPHQTIHLKQSGPIPFSNFQQQYPIHHSSYRNLAPIPYGQPTLGNAPFVNLRQSNVISPPIMHSSGFHGATFNRPVPMQRSVFGAGPLNTVSPLQAGFSVAPLQRSTTLHASAANLTQSQIVARETVQTGEVIKGETIIEYVPFEREYIEQVEVERTELIPIERRYTDYYAIENITEYVPVSRYEKVQELVPQERTEYVAQTKVQYIPQVETEYITVNKVQAKTDYVTQEKQKVIYPEYEGEFVKDAELSGRIVSGGPGRLVNSGFIAPQAQYLGQSAGTWNTSAGPWTQSVGAANIQGGFVSSPGLKSPAIVKERYLLKKLEKDIKKLEKETKLQRSQSHSPGKRHKKHHETDEVEVQEVKAEALEGN